MVFSQSKKAEFLLQSEIRNMSIECARVQGINLAQGMCDLPLEKALAEGAFDAIKKGENHYTRYDGIEALRRQIALKSRKFNNLQVEEGNIVVSAGATGALYSVCFALFNPGDEIILFEPYYGYHRYTLLALDLVPKFARLRAPDWSFDIEELRRLITAKTKGIIICTPSNPCGKVFSKKELEELGAFCADNNLIVMTDEIYEYITYNGTRHISPASLDVFKERTVTISGYSKTFSITGWRVGYCVAPEAIIKWIGNANDLIYVCAPAPLQWGVAEAIKAVPDSFYENLKNDYRKKRDLLCGALSGIGLPPYIPQGAYYVLSDISKIPGETGKEKCMFILKETGVAVVPGEAFFNGDAGNNLARFCFAKDINVIERACEALYKLK